MTAPNTAPAVRQSLSPIIKTFVPGLMEVGKIKIGIKGQKRTSKNGTEFQPPQKLDHFVITTLHRDESGNFTRDEAMHRRFGEKPTRIPVILMFDDIGLNFRTRYVCFQGKKQFCTGDGEIAFRHGAETPVPCPCERCAQDYQGKDRCKINGVLSVIIKDAEHFGGAWKFRTTSWNTVQGILSSLMAIKNITGGPLAGLPLWMTLAPKTVINPQDGNTQTVYVVGIEFDGNWTMLREEGIRQLRDASEHRRQVLQLEANMRATMPAEIVTDDEVDDYQEEFSPEQVDGYVAPKPATVNIDEPVAGDEPEPAEEPAHEEPEATENVPNDEPEPEPAIATLDLF